MKNKELKENNEKKNIIKIKKLPLLFIAGFLLIIFLSIFIQAYSYSKPQYYQPTPHRYYGGSRINQYWPRFSEKEVCETGTDFIVNVAPAGCQPTVVRSDLLEDQDVPVFCQLDAIKINPTVDVDSIIDIDFPMQERDNKYIAGIGFHPAQAALRTRETLLGSPMLNNIGYAVVILRRQQNESSMPDWVVANLTARLKYDADYGFGTGKSHLYLPALTDEEWARDYVSYGFWQGKGFLRADMIGDNQARISLYTDEDNRIKTLDLERGEVSDLIYMPGYYCRAGVKLQLEDVEKPSIKVKLQVDEDELWLVEGQRFLNDKCRVRDITSLSEGGKVKISCSGSSAIELKMSMSDFVKIDFNGKKIDVKVGEEIEPESGVYLAYSGIAPKTVFAGIPDTPKQDRRFIILVKNVPDIFIDFKEGKLTDEALENIETKVESYSPIARIASWFGSDYREGYNYFTKYSISNILNLRTPGSDDSINIEATTNEMEGKIIMPWYDEEVELSDNEKIKFIGTAELIDEDLSKKGTVGEGREFSSYFEKTTETTNSLVDLYGSEKKDLTSEDEEYYGEIALKKAIKLAEDAGQSKTAKELMEKYIEEYPNSDYSKIIKNRLENLNNYNFEEAGDFVEINYKPYYLKILDIKEPSFDEASVEISLNGEPSRRYVGGDYIFGQNLLGKSSFDIAVIEVYEDDAMKWIKTTEGDFAKGDEAIYGKRLGIKYKVNQPYKEKIDEIIDPKHDKAKFDENYKDLKLQSGNIIKNKNPILITSSGNTFAYVNNEVYIQRYDGWVEYDKYRPRQNYLRLDDFDNDKAYFTYNYKEESSKYVTQKIEISERGTEVFGDTIVKVNEIYLKQEASVKIIPEIEKKYSETNFTVKIGIEKRDIELTPDKALKKIESLNKTIENWEETSEKLGKTVKTLKGACIGAGALLTVKNLVQNWGGKGLARQEIMNADGGWKDICQNAVSTGKIGDRTVDYKSLDECYFKENDNIEADVNSLYDKMSKQNQEIKNLQTPYTKKNVFGERNINTEEFMQDYIDRVNDKKLNIDDGVLKNSKGSDEINANQILSGLEKQDYKNRHISVEQARNIDLWVDVLNDEKSSDYMKNIAEKNLYNSLSLINKRKTAEQRTSTISSELGMNFNLWEKKNIEAKEYTPTQYSQISSGAGNKPINPANDKKSEEAFSKIENNDFVAGLVGTNNVNYFFVLNDKVRDTKKYPIKQSFKLTDKGDYYEAVLIDKDDDKDDDKDIDDIYFEEYDQTKYKNKYKNPEARFFETEPYRGMPAVVPFDLNNGWYAATQQSLPIFGNMQSYDESGRVTSYWLCNVGSDGQEEFNAAISGDICRMINLDTGEPLDVFPYLSKRDAQQKVQDGVRALQQAAKQYKSGIRRIQISTSSGRFNIDVGNPAVDVPAVQCQDFMSPSDCRLLFNLCDPVICPPSRCDLGGQFPVQDVIRSGIIGSIALCLPNAREGIIIPVCLSGIHAGIEGYLSVIKAYRGCLQEKVETGKNVGICDEFYSIYSCEFFWRQFGSMSDVIVPKLLEWVSGQSVKGGGEYLSVSDAWSRADDSIKWMTQHYAKNAFTAFKARTTDEVGTEICQAFISARYPGSEDFLDSLTEPDSPVQFHAQFDEIPFTTATVPSTSQYKVFYHIYAGKDQGVYYSIYLRNPPGTSYYQDLQRVHVDNGYIPKGEYADESIDFTAPSGYRELCVTINGQEECGFKKVSTNFALEYINEKYLQEQASQTDISSTKECVSGSMSFYPMVSPNLQEGAEEAIEPEIYNRGIIRICSSENPGAGTDESRWKAVGYCDDESIICWLDEDSVKDNIKVKDLQNKTLQEVADDAAKRLTESGKYDNELQAASKIKEIEEQYKELINKRDVRDLNNFVAEIQNQYERTIMSHQKALLLFLKQGVYERITRIFWQEINPQVCDNICKKEYGDDYKGLKYSLEDCSKIEGSFKKDYGECCCTKKTLEDWETEREITETAENETEEEEEESIETDEKQCNEMTLIECGSSNSCYWYKDSFFDLEIFSENCRNCPLGPVFDLSKADSLEHCEELCMQCDINCEWNSEEKECAVKVEKKDEEESETEKKYFLDKETESLFKLIYGNSKEQDYTCIYVQNNDVFVDFIDTPFIIGYYDSSKERIISESSKRNAVINSLNKETRNLSSGCSKQLTIETIEAISISTFTLLDPSISIA